MCDFIPQKLCNFLSHKHDCMSHDDFISHDFTTRKCDFIPQNCEFVPQNHYFISHNCNLFLFQIFVHNYLWINKISQILFNLFLLWGKKHASIRSTAGSAITKHCTLLLLQIFDYLMYLIWPLFKEIRAPNVRLLTSVCPCLSRLHVREMTMLLTEHYLIPCIMFENKRALGDHLW